MTITETSRFQWPIPAWNADWLEWQGKFQDLVSNVDATTFGVMSNMQLVLKQLPNVTSAFSLGEWQLTMDADAIFVSRTLLTDTRLAAETLTLTADSVIGITLTPGAVGVQNVSWEVFTQGVPIAPEVVPLGYVDDAFNILWYNGAILVSGTTAQLFFMTGGGGGTSDMDDTHNAFGGSPAIVTIDGAEGQGDLRFRPTDAFSFVVDVASCTGASDGFSVVNGSDQFDLIRRGANDMDLDADLGEFDISALDSSFIGASGATADLSLGARGESIALNQPGDTALDAAYGAAGATSIIGAFNVLASGPGFLTDLNEGYDNFGASPAAVVIDNAEGQGDLVWSPTGAFSFAVDISGVTGAADGFQITDGADQFNLTHAGVNDMDLDADLGEFNIAAASASVVTVDAGDLMLSTTTSGSLLLDGVGLVDINAGANLDIDVAGDYTIDATGLVSMQGVGASDLTIVSGDLSVQTLTSGSLILDGVALVDINAGANLDIDVVGDYTMDSTGTFSMDGVGVSNITNDAGNLTVSTITSGSLVLDAVALLDINAGANLDIDVVGLVDIDATAASRFVVSGATSDLTIGARGSTVTLNQTGNTALVGFTATSIIGGMNELKTANHARSHAVTSTSDHTAGNWSIFASNGSGQVTEIGHGASGTVLKSNGTTSAPTWQSDAVNDPTLDDGYDNFGSNPATVIIDNAEEQGSLTWETHDGNDFIIDVSNSSNPFVNGRTTPYGLSVECGTDHYNVGRLADNEITVDGLIASMDIDASEYIRFDAIDSSNFSVTGGSLTISTIASGELDLTSAGLLDINAGANLDMDVTGTLAMDATGTIEWSGTNASLTSAGVLFAGQLGVGTDAPTDKVGIKSAGGTAIASLGSTLLTNGDFASDLSSWTAGAGWSWSSGTALHTAGNTATLTQGVSVFSSAQYQFSVTVSGRTAGSVTVSFVGSNETVVLGLDSTYNVSFRAASTSTINLVFTPTTDFDGALDDVTFKLITPASTYDFALYDTTGARSGLMSITGVASRYNSFLGEGVGRYNTIGALNIAQGYLALTANTTGSYNSAHGVQSLYSNTTGVRNSAQGYRSLTANATGSYNSAHGGQSLYSNTTGSYNSAQGYRAGRDTSSGGANQTSNYCTFIGYDTRVNADGDTNETAIGNAAIGIGSNTITLGNSAVTQTRLGGIISTINGGDSSNYIFDALSIGHDTVTDDSFIQSAGAAAGSELQLNPEGGDVIMPNIGITGSVTHNVTTVNAATYDLLASDYIVHVTYPSTGAVTSLTLPTAQVVSGRYVIIKDAGGNASANNITVDTQGAETIDGSATQVLSTDYEWMILYSDGSNWFVVGG